METFLTFLSNLYLERLLGITVEMKTFQKHFQKFDFVLGRVGVSNASAKRFLPEINLHAEFHISFFYLKPIPHTQGSFHGLLIATPNLLTLFQEQP